MITPHQWAKTDRAFRAASGLFVASVVLLVASFVYVRLASWWPPAVAVAVEVCDPATYRPGVPLTAQVGSLAPYTPGAGCTPPPLPDAVRIDEWASSTAIAGQVCSTARATYEVTVRFDAVDDPDAPQPKLVDTVVTYPEGCVRPYALSWPLPDSVADFVADHPAGVTYRVVGFARSIDGSVGSYGWDSLTAVRIMP